MNTEMVETYRYLRDHGKPVSQQDAADYAAIRAPAPPSRALLKRVRRAQEGRDPRRDPNPPVPAQPVRYAHLEFHKKMIAQLGGNRTIAPAPQAVPIARQIVHVPADPKGVLPPVSEREKLHRESRRLQRTHIVAMSKMYATEYQPDMFEILDTFGNFPNYAKEL